MLAAAPSPEKGRTLTRSRIAAVLRRAGRKRGVDAAAERIQAGLRAPQLDLAPELADAYAVTVSALVAVIGEPSPTSASHSTARTRPLASRMACQAEINSG